MASPADGAYIILNVNSQLAIDVKGASDKSGANVQQWTKNNGDAQIWSFDKPENGGYQITCSLTGKVLEVQSGNLKNDANVRQWSDNNSNAQRWNVNTDGKTFTYGGKSYPSYTIKPTKATSFALDVAGGSTTRGANIRIHTANNSDAQRWILIPVSILKSEGTYEIVLAADPKMCLDIAGGSTANEANVQVYTRNESPAQVFRTDVNDETFVTRFINGKSGKVLEVAGGKTAAGTNVQQYKANNSAAQNWLPIQSGSVKINGQNVPTYAIHAQVGNNLCMDCKGGGKKAKTNIQVYTSANTLAQRFAFVKTELLGTDISVPGAIQQTLFKRKGPGAITVSGLTFNSKQTMFQARYLIRYYTKGRKSYKSTKWMNLKNNSAAREGWGDAWSYTFKATPSNGIIKVPFNKKVNLTSTYRSADIYVEVRTFLTNYKSGFKAHGTTKRTIIKLRQVPAISMSSCALVIGSNNIGVKTVLKDSLGEGCNRLRGRLVGSDGLPISEWVSVTKMNMTHMLGKTLSRLPRNGEKISFEYVMLINDGITLTGSFKHKNGFSMGGLTSTFTPTVVYSQPIDEVDDLKESCCILVTTNRHKSDCLLYSVSTIAGSKMVKADIYSTTSTEITWKVAPPLNKTVKLNVYSNTSTNPALKSGWRLGQVDVKITSHTFVWNWGLNAESKRKQYATLIVNSDNPPQQTRNFTNDISFHSPAGRIWPVAFATRALGADVSVSGISVDSAAVKKHSVGGPIPLRGTVGCLMTLVPLAGKGIHPIYRTPYGDWYQVGVESVDVSKNNMYYSDVQVTQRALED